jgi:hypothetical protein
MTGPRSPDALSAHTGRAKRSSASEPTGASDRGTALGPPQFSLRSLLLAVGGVFLLIAVFDWVGAAWAAPLAFLMILVVGHVLGNVVGTRLRDAGSTCQRPATASISQTTGNSTANSTTAATAGGRVRIPSVRRSHLCDKTPLDRGVWLLVGLGIAAGSLAGGTLLATLQWQDITWIGLLLGAVSAGILGGWLTLLGATFLHAAGRAWREAVEHHERSI